MRTRWLIALIVVLVVILVACGDDDDVDQTFTSPEERFLVDPGDQFTVVLESNATTGFMWELSADIPREVVVLVQDMYIEPDTDLVGAPGRQELTFEATGEGSTFIQLWYIRSFDDPPEPADRAQFEVIVGDGVGDDQPVPDEGDEPQAPIPDDEDALSVPDLLATSPSGEVVLRGLFFDDGSGLVVCDALAESFPPQCPGPQISITNPAAAAAAFTEEGGVRWTDQPVVLLGTLAGDGFEIIAMQSS